MAKKNQLLRELVIEQYLSGKNPNQIKDIELDKVSIRTIYNWIKQFEQNGQTKDQNHSGRPCKYSYNKKKKIKRLVREKKPVRAIGRLLKIPETSVRRYVKTTGLKVT